jgi:hypothetical protein
MTKKQKIEACSEIVTSVFPEWEKPTPGPMHDSKFWKECHLLAPIVGSSHSEKTLIVIHSLRNPSYYVQGSSIMFL